jgi:hypothetical protein
MVSSSLPASPTLTHGCNAQKMSISRRKSDPLFEDLVDSISPVVSGGRVRDNMNHGRPIGGIAIRSAADGVNHHSKFPLRII